jgi:hypothetical protein
MPAGLVRFLFDQLRSSLPAVLPGWTTCCCRWCRLVRSPFLFGLVILDIHGDNRVDQHRTFRSICLYHWHWAHPAAASFAARSPIADQSSLSPP